jgi:hypothetical protein
MNDQIEFVCSTVFCDEEMDRRMGSTMYKQQIKQMLRDAICVLCKNAVAHHVQLSVEALIGITVDNGTDILLVSIKELFEKSETAGKHSSEAGEQRKTAATRDVADGISFSSDRSDNERVVTAYTAATAMMCCRPDVRIASRTSNRNDCGFERLPNRCGSERGGVFGR